MIVYYSITLLACSCSMLDRIGARQSRYWRIAALLISACVFAVFAGLRSEEVGTDTLVYGLPSYNSAKTSSFLYFYIYGTYRSWSPLFKILAWTSSQVGQSPFFYFFAVELLTVLPVLFAANALCQDYCPLAIAVYGLVFYPMSFNLMRQMIAMSFIILSYERLIAGRRIWCALFLLVALGFHQSALVALGIFILHFIAKLKVFSGPIKVAMVALGTFTMLLIAQPLLQAFTSLMGLYTKYVSGIHVVEGGGLRAIIEIAGIFIVLAFISLTFLHGRKIEERDKNLILSLILIVIFGVLTYSLALISRWLYRIGLFYVYFSILLLPAVIRLVPGKRERLVLILASLALLAYFSYDYYAIQLNEEAFPYIFN